MRNRLPTSAPPLTPSCRCASLSGWAAGVSNRRSLARGRAGRRGAALSRRCAAALAWRRPLPLSTSVPVLSSRATAAASWGRRALPAGRAGASGPCGALGVQADKGAVQLGVVQLLQRVVHVLTTRVLDDADREREGGEEGRQRSGGRDEGEAQREGRASMVRMGQAGWATAGRGLASSSCRRVTPRPPPPFRVWGFKRWQRPTGAKGPQERASERAAALSGLPSVVGEGKWRRRGRWGMECVAARPPPPAPPAVAVRQDGMGLLMTPSAQQQHCHATAERHTADGQQRPPDRRRAATTSRLASSSPPPVCAACG